MSMFRSFSVYNYRVWFIGALVSNIGQWMQATALSWVVLTVLTDNDAGAMGITMALQFGPPLLLVGVTGWVADRFDRRHLLMLTQAALMLLGATIGVLILLGAMSLPLMYGFAVVLGVIAAFDNPARQAFVSDLVARENASNAIALNAASFNSARMIGPAVAGVVIVAVGTGWVFVFNALTFVGMIAALAIIRPAELVPRAKAQGAARLADGFRYVARRSDLIVTFVIVFLIGAFGMNFPIYASTMAIEFGREADGFGFLSSILAVGSLTGALLAARRDRARFRVILFGVGLFAVSAAAGAYMPAYWAYAITLMFLGFAMVTMLTTANGYVQTTTEPALRGRVLALYMAVLMGGMPFGAPIVGAVVETFGPRVGILVGAGAGVVAFAIGATWLLSSGRVHRHERRRFRLTIDETLPVTVVRATPEEFSDQIAQTTPIPVAPDSRRTGRSGAAEQDAADRAARRATTPLREPRRATAPSRDPRSGRPVNRPEQPPRRPARPGSPRPE